MEKINAYFTTRVGRLQFFLGSFILALGFGVIQLILSIIFDNQMLDAKLNELTDIIVSVFGISLAIRRNHDFGKPWIRTLFLLIPLVNLYFLFELLFKAGDPKSNQWGKPSKDFLKGLFTPYAQ